MWDEHGRQNGLNLEPGKLNELMQRAEPYARLHGVQAGAFDLPPPRADELQNQNLAASYHANQILRLYYLNQRDTNYKYFLYESRFEMSDEAIKCRKLFYEADQERRRDRVGAAIALYEQALGTQQKAGPWKQLLINSEFTSLTDRFVDHILEETYKQQLHYQMLLRDRHRPELQKATLALFDIGRMGGVGLTLPLVDLLVKDKVPDLERMEPLWPPGPFDGVGPNGVAWIPDEIVRRVRQEMGLRMPQDQARKPPPPRKKHK